MPDGRVRARPRRRVAGRARRRALAGCASPLRRPKSPAPSRRSGPRDPLRAEFVQIPSAGAAGSHSFEERMRAARSLILAALTLVLIAAPAAAQAQSTDMPLHRLRARGCTARRRHPGSADRGGDEVPLRRGRLHHGAALLQAAEQHGHARRAPVVEHGPAARRGGVHGRDRLGLAGGGAAHGGADHARTPPTSPPTTRARDASPSAAGTSSAASTARRFTLCPTPSPAATASTTTGRAPSPTRPSTPRTTGSTPCSTGCPPRTRARRE